MKMSRLDSAIDQIESARRYTLTLIADMEPGDWFHQPAEGVTHVAWQVGHLAFAQFRLANLRIRGPRPDDSELVPDDLATLFGKGSVPSPDPSLYPDTQEIRALFDRVHERTVSDLRQLPDKILDEPSEPVHEMFSTKLGALHWAAQHEFIHAGQIGLLRRLLGRATLR
jgi:hypothetical protein